MEVAAAFLGCLLLAQFGEATEPMPLAQQVDAAELQPLFNPAEDIRAVSAPHTPQQETAGDFATAPNRPSNTVPSENGRSHPQQMVAAAMTMPSQSPLTGQPVTLLQALSSTPDRRRQLEIARAYWWLTQTLADYRFCADHVDQLAKLLARGDAATARMAGAAAAAMLRDAELAATEAQYDLAAQMAMPPDAGLPLPADRPHVGAYRTSFQELFAGRAAPDRARLLDRTLPIWRLAIDQRAAAVQAGEDVLEAVAEKPLATPADASTIVGSCEALLRDRRAFIHAVCNYNRDIAEYGLTVAAPGTTPQILTAMLIGSPSDGASSSAAQNESNSAVHPAGLTVPQNPAGSQPFRREPTPAKPRDAGNVNPRREPTPAPPRETWNQNSRNRTFDDDTKPANSDEIVIPLTDDGADTSHPGRQEETSREPSLVPVAPSPTSSETQSTTARKPAEWSSVASVDPSRQTVSETPRNSVIGSLLYPGLVGVAPATRAKQLSIALGADRALPETAGKPIGLVECLQHAHGDRRTAVESYWRLRQRTAEHQQFAQQAEWIDSLKAATLEHRGQPAGPVDMLRLHAVALATKAVLYETNIRMLEAQSDLAGRTGAAMASTWPLAATPPHAGKYLLNLESQPRNLATSWSIRRLATRIPSLGDSVAQHAAAVVEADAARADAIAQYSASAASIEPVLENIRRQTDQTDAFLTAITEYNLAIADYALAIMPSDTPADKLAAALVVKP